MMDTAESYRYCEGIAKARARNFYYSFLLLPKPKRQAMCAVYAFMRVCDDLADEPGATQAALDQWRMHLDRALAGGVEGHPVWPAFADTAHRFRIPPRYFHEMLDGVSSDLETHAIATGEDLERYCYLVASVVGLTIVHIFGFTDPRALELAENCGQAFQITNIIRDVKEDAAMGRVYLPAVPLEVATTPDVRPHLQRLGSRALQLYERSRPLVDMVDPDSRAALWALIEMYHRLLKKIEASGYRVFDAPVRLSRWEKMAVVAQAALRRR